MKRFFAVLRMTAGLLALASSVAFAQTPELDASLNETVVMVPKKGMFTVDLETTLYKPDGPGPFPVALINHGKAFGDPRFQARYRPAVAARYFLQRGYAVVVPMRQGFSKSGGGYVGGGCNVESNGRTQAEDVKGVLDWLGTQPWADMQRVVVVGQSHGGWTTMAFGTLGYPGVKGLINFAGGLRQENCPQWQPQLASGVANYAKATKVPSLWFYGDNDSYFNPETWRAMHEQYQGAGGQARIVAFGTFGTDAHGMFGSRNGARIWQPEVTRFLLQIGMPSETQQAFSRFGTEGGGMPRPESTTFAALNDEAKLPHLRDGGRAGYRAYLGKALPRAFAISPSGAWGWADGGDDPLQRALNNCNRNATAPCKLYSVDNDVVWKE